MAVYSGTPVVVRSWTIKGQGAQFAHRVLQITLASQGGTTNKITANSLNFARIDGCSSLVKSDNSSVVGAAPSYLGDLLMSLSGTTPTDVTGTYQIEVWGQPGTTVNGRFVS